MDLCGDEVCVDLLEATTPSAGREVKAWETLEKTCGIIHDADDNDGNYQNILSCVIKFQTELFLRLVKETKQ